MSRFEAVRFLRRDPIGLLERAADLGDVVRVRVPRLDLYVINHPDLVWDVLATDARAFSKGPTMQAAKRTLGESLLTSEGDHHRRQRRLIQPLFHQARVAGYGDVFARLADEHHRRWRDGQTLDVHAEMTELTLGIVARTVFDVDLETEFIAHVRRSLATNMRTTRRQLVPWGRILDRLPLPSTRRFNARPCTVWLESTGREAPRPSLSIADAGNPSVSCMASATRCALAFDSAT